MVQLVRHRQTKESATDRLHLNHRVTPRLHTTEKGCRLISWLTNLKDSTTLSTHQTSIYVGSAGLSGSSRRPARRTGACGLARGSGAMFTPLIATVVSAVFRLRDSANGTQIGPCAFLNH